MKISRNLLFLTKKCKISPSVTCNFSTLRLLLYNPSKQYPSTRHNLLTSDGVSKHLVRHYKGLGSEDGPNFDFEQFGVDRIRNFCIIAHVDHGKSTLADRILELSGAIKSSSDNAQVLDTLQVEKERGITVKAQTVSLVHNYKGTDYLLNLIDTPGHVDFSYEVSRSLAACQGAVLLVDANKGVQAQTVANFYSAFSADLSIVPALNKIDLPNADIDATKLQMLSAFEIDPDEVLHISAKFGTGVIDLLDQIVEKIKPPTHCKLEAPFRGLLYDTWFHSHKGVVCHVAAIDGSVTVGNTLIAASTGNTFTVKEVGIYTPTPAVVKKICAGQVGYLTANMKSVKEAAVGDTLKSNKNVPDLPGFVAAKPMVFAGVYPAVQKDAAQLSRAMQRLVLNDSSVSLTKESSAALGQGWRVGFLGLLHLDVFLQRLEQEYEAPTVTTTPSVPYKIKLKGKAVKEHRAEEITITNPLLWPDIVFIAETYEPYVLATIISPVDYMNSIIGLCESRRGRQTSTRELDGTRLMSQFHLPLSEVVVDFYDALKSMSSGYATFDYEDIGYRQSSLVKLNILVNSEPVEELCAIVHAEGARAYGKRLAAKLKEAIPRQLYKVAIQATVGSTVLAREDVKANRKNVTAKCYGGDMSRKMKLLKFQAEGKARMRKVGNIEIPREAFINVLKK